jgi:hypothetical protein
MASDYKQKWQKGLALWDCYQLYFKRALCEIAQNQKSFEAQRGLNKSTKSKPFKYEEYKLSPEGMENSKEASRQARNSIIERLICCEAYAFGMKEQDQTSGNIVPIDGAIMAQAESNRVDGSKVYYQRGTLQHDGAHYTHVRIFDENDFQNVGLVQSELAPTLKTEIEAIKRKPGPKSFETEILAAISFCKEQDKNIWAKTRRERIALYKIFLEEKYPDLNLAQRGLSNKIFEKYENFYKQKQYANRL